MPYGDLTGSRAGRGWRGGSGSRRQTIVYRHPKAFKAKFRGTCAECHRTIQPGEHIRRRADDSGKYQHVSCYFK